MKYSNILRLAMVILLLTGCSTKTLVSNAKEVKEAGKIMSSTFEEGSKYQVTLPPEMEVGNKDNPNEYWYTYVKEGTSNSSYDVVELSYIGNFKETERKKALNQHLITNPRPDYVDMDPEDITDMVEVLSYKVKEADGILYYSMILNRDNHLIAVELQQNKNEKLELRLKKIHKFIDSIQIVKKSVPKSSDQTKSKQEEFPNPSTLKDNELAIIVRGKPEIIPAEIIENVGFAKEIKVPKGTNLTVNKEDNAIVDGGETSKMGIREVMTDDSVDSFLKVFKRLMEASEPDRIVPVNEVDITQFPQLKGYPVMLKVEGKEEITYYTVKSYESNGKKIVREIMIMIKPSVKGVALESTLSRYLSTAATVKSQLEP
jgi:hypothetical protein